ncbi:MAG: tRNA (adenosine(37)-N6)-threonylcarbamoyltransferase complex transferase subunit TsaD [Candidatus Daviesbacteria bacterium]|nr:tRNA (adenosine(37)-N6)-threonylcarbamoyltransferase complex transferase subunit TsaD [Candidatus Daviesbacteria bacterium]
MNKPQIILGIESSCDETAAAVVQKTGKRVKVLSNVVASSAELQAKYGGVIPEQAAREQIKSIIPVIEDCLQVSGYKRENIDAIAVTNGPGLIGSLLVGVETAKALATVWDKPLIPVNHLLGHFYANWISISANQYISGSVDQKETDTPTHRHTDTPKFPCLGLLVSGGHTDLVLFKNHGEYEYLGGTRDDAAGECFDKCARLLDLPYPGGPAISKLASQGDALRFNLPRPMINSKDFDFSFSGLKTAVANLLHTLSVPELGNEVNKEVNQDHTSEVKADLAAAIEQAIVDVLVAKTLAAAKKYQVKKIIVAGGVAANQKLTSDLKLKIKSEKLKIKLFIPPANLCTDNAAMIAATACFNYHPINPLTLQANPNLSL